MARRPIDSYLNVKKSELKEDKSSYEIVSMLLQGIIDKVSMAIFYIKSGDIAKKGECLGVAISIIEVLKHSLDKNTGGELAENLENLYIFSLDEIINANIDNSTEKLDNVLAVVQNIKSGWDNIQPEGE